MESQQKTQVLNRLKSIQGHLRGVQRMVEEDQYCIDIIRQTLAVQRAIDKVNAMNRFRYGGFYKSLGLTLAQIEQFEALQREGSSTTILLGGQMAALSAGTGMPPSETGSRLLELLVRWIPEVGGIPKNRTRAPLYRPGGQCAMFHRIAAGAGAVGSIGSNHSRQPIQPARGASQ